jgi:DNA-binding IclR family transcriptional regulator
MQIEPDAKQDRQFVTSLARGLEILRCFSEHRPVLGSTEIAQLTGLPQPTVWRLCHTLVKTGYLVPVPKGDKLRIGGAVLSLGYAAIGSLDFLQIARPHMQEMADKYAAAVALAERHRTSMVYLERCQGESMLLMNLKVGSRIPMYLSATGWAWLAAVTAERRAPLMQQMKARSGADWPAYEARISEAFDQYQARGFIVNSGHEYPGVAAAAVPVISSDGQTILSLNCGGPSSVLTPVIMNGQIGPDLVALARLLAPELPAKKPGPKARQRTGNAS